MSERLVDADVSLTNPDQRPRYPFTAIVGQDQLKLALILCAVSPEIGGVLIRGEKGTAKTTTVRGLGPLLAGRAQDSVGRVVELPIGATEDRVIGSLDLGAVLRDGRAEFTPGLLARAHRGVLYIDEVNLLADHLVDILLDAAATGAVTIERDAVSHTQPAQFVLVGTMNPEEGELRPQLLDRFGLAVDVSAGRDVGERVDIVRRRMDFDVDPSGFVERYATAEDDLAQRISAARATVSAVDIPVSELRRIAGICAHLDVDGLRGDIVVARAAAAHAALRGALAVAADDVHIAVGLALPHRRRRNPFDDAGLTQDELDEAFAAGAEAAEEQDDPEPPPGGGGTHSDSNSDPASEDTGGARRDERTNAAADSDRDTTSAQQQPADDTVGGGDHTDGAHNGDADNGDADNDDGTPSQSAGDDSAAAEDKSAPGPAPTGAAFGHPQHRAHTRMRTLAVAGIGIGEAGRRSRAAGRRGHTVRAVDFHSGAPVHLFGSVLAAAERATTAKQAATAGVRVAAADLRAAQRVGQEGNLVVFVVDLSGSMTARKRLQAVSELCVDMLRDSYTRRDRVAVVIARGSTAEVAVPPTKSVDIAVRRLAEVRTGGRTPLAEGLMSAMTLIERSHRREPNRRPLLVALTDGRATAGADAASRATHVARAIGRRGVESVVVDCEQGMIRLGLAARLAADLGGRHMPMEQLSAASLTSAA